MGATRLLRLKKTWKYECVDIDLEGKIIYQLCINPAAADMLTTKSKYWKEEATAEGGWLSLGGEMRTSKIFHFFFEE